MRLPSENFLSRFLTFHSTSAGGFLEPPPKYMSYSIFSRRSWSSSRLSSSSIAKVAAPFQGRARSREHLGGIYHSPTATPMCSRYSRQPSLGYFAGGADARKRPEFRIRLFFS